MHTQRSFLIAVFALCAALCACGGGKTSNAVPPVQPAQAGGTTPTPPATSANAIFRFIIPASSSPQPGQQTQGVNRKPEYISASTLSISLSLNTVNGATPSPLPTAQVVNVTSTTNGCSTSAGETTCTATMHLPVGTDVITVSTYDASNAGGHILSQQIYAASVTAGSADSFSFALDANPNNATISVAATSGETGSQSTSAPGFTILTTGGNQTFAVSLTDAAGNTILTSTPGYPSLSPSSGNTGVVTVSMVSNTLTVHPVAAGNASVTITAAPANSQSGSDGLTNGTVSFYVTSATPTPTPTPTATPTPTPTDWIAVGELNMGSLTSPKIGIYSYTEGSGTAPAVYGTIPTSSLPSSPIGASWPFYLAFSSGGNLWVSDNNNGKILQFLAANLNASPPTANTTISLGASGGPEQIGVSSSERVGVASISAVNDMYEFTSGGSTVATYSSSSSTGQGFAYIPGAGGFGADSAAFVHSVFGGSPSSELVICNGTSSSTCATNTVVTSHVNSPGDSQALLAWNAGNNQLVLANSDAVLAGDDTVYSYTFSGAALSGSPANLLSPSNPPAALATSPDGHVAVASCVGGVPANSNVDDTCTVTVVTGSGGAVSGWTAKSIAGVSGLAFLPNNQLVVTTNTSNTAGALTIYTPTSSSSATASVSIGSLAPISVTAF